MLEKLLRFIRQAGATSESETERSGFMSWKAETHALFGSAALTFTLLVSGAAKVLGVFVFTILYTSRGDTITSMSIVREMVVEKGYTLSGIVLGAIITMAYMAVLP